MTLRSWPIAGLLLLAAGAGPAPAQQPAFLIVPGDKAAVRPGPGVQLGFFDPATGRFTQATPAPASAAVPPPVSGTLTVRPNLDLDEDFGPLYTIFCVVTLVFGNLSEGVFYANHYAGASVNFAAGNAAGQEIPVPYAYTPNSDNARYRLSLVCRGRDIDGREHDENTFEPPATLPNGNQTRSVYGAF